MSNLVETLYQLTEGMYIGKIEDIQNINITNLHDKGLNELFKKFDIKTFEMDYSELILANSERRFVLSCNVKNNRIESIYSKNGLEWKIMTDKERFTEMAKRIQDAGNKLVMVINNDEMPGVVEIQEYDTIDDGGVMTPNELINVDTFYIDNEEAEEILWNLGFIYPEIRDMKE